VSDAVESAGQGHALRQCAVSLRQSANSLASTLQTLLSVIDIGEILKNNSTIMQELSFNI